MSSLNSARSPLRVWLVEIFAFVKTPDVMNSCFKNGFVSTENLHSSSHLTVLFKNYN